MATKLIDSRTFSGVFVVLRRSTNKISIEAGRSYFLVVDGKVIYPRKEDGVTDEASARSWANLHCRKAGLLRR